MQSELEKKYFVSADSMLNGDDAPFSVLTNQWVNLENIRFETTDKGSAKQGQFIGGTKLLSTPQPSINYINIGSVGDEENDRLVNFKFNTTGRQDKITCYYSTTETEYDVLLSSQVTGGLNFSKNSLIHSAFIVNGYLYFPDGTNNQPRKINLEAAIKANNPSFVTNQQAYTFPLNFSEITIIKPPPALAANILKQTDGGFDNNFIDKESFEAAFEYGFYDNEITVVGTYSPASRLNAATETYNFIQVTMDFREFIPSTVRFVNLIIRISNTNNAFIVKTWDREVTSENTEIEEQNSNTNPLTFNFYNNTTGEYLSNGDNGSINQVLKPFDNVPIYSETGAAAKKQKFLGQ